MPRGARSAKQLIAIGLPWTPGRSQSEASYRDPHGWLKVVCPLHEQAGAYVPCPGVHYSE